MWIARILLACTMLVATIFRTLPDSVFDHFHNHEHAFHSDSETSVGNYKHLCHIEDWNFEALEATDLCFDYVQNTFLSSFITKPFELVFIHTQTGIGRAPPAILA